MTQVRGDDEILIVVERSVLKTTKLDKTVPEMNTDREQTPPRLRGQRNERKPAKETRRSSNVLEAK